MADQETSTGPGAPIRRNVTIRGRRTSIRMEPAMWDALNEICSREGRSVNDLCGIIETRRRDRGLTASLRIFIISYFREAAERTGRRYAGGFAEGPPAPGPLVRAALNAVGHPDD